MQSILDSQAFLHVAIIMDGNGRWATRRGLPRFLGHRRGVDSVRRIVEAAPGLGIGALPLFAFSSDNWRRPGEEVGALMALLREYLAREAGRLAGAGVALHVFGRRDRLPPGLAEAIAAAERLTQAGSRLRLNVALDYSSRHAIAEASIAAVPAAPHRTILPDVDLLIRTGGEKRLSDFLLWEAVYAELLFTDTAWPDFGSPNLADAVAEFHRRDRRFGAAPAPRLQAAE